MEILRFAHQFFHFNSAAWEKLRAGQPADERLSQRLFLEPLLPKRQLRQCNFPSFEQARVLFESTRAREDALGIRALTPEMPEYPEAIRAHIPPDRRPPVLYLRGEPMPQEGGLAAIVGTRRPSPLGIEAARSFTTYLTALDIRIASGLARGIDSIAHRESLRLGGTAILGGDIDEVYPPENQSLAEEILRNGGTLLSPFPLGQVPLPQNFPQRNELIAALAAGVLVVEGAEKSGAAVTARHALAMGKCAVTLTQDFRSSFGRGAIALQRDGAVLVTQEEEAVEALFQRLGGLPGQRPLFPLGPRRTSFSFQEFHNAAKVSVPEALALLEEGILQGRIERYGSRFRLRTKLV